MNHPLGPIQYASDRKLIQPQSSVEIDFEICIRLQTFATNESIDFNTHTEILLLTKPTAQLLVLPTW